MKVTVKNLGAINNATVELKKLTLLFGENNSGKTYLSYAIWGVINHLLQRSSMKFPQEGASALIETGVYKFNWEFIEKSKLLETQLVEYGKNLHKIFSSQDDIFDTFSISIDDPDVISYNGTVKLPGIGFGKAQLELSLIQDSAKSYSLIATRNGEIDGKNIPSFIVGDLIGRILPKGFISLPYKRAFAITSERTGVALFFRNLDYKNNAAIDYILNNKGKDIDPFELIEKTTSRYAAPIQENIDYARDYQDTSKNTSFFFKDIEKYGDITLLWVDLLGGKFDFVNGQIFYIPTNSTAAIPIHMASSSVKSLFLIDEYFRHSAKSGDILFIDEPELNLNAKNQVKMAKFLALLVKYGIHVFATTHSDYISREINLLIGEDLQSEEIAVYCGFKNGTVCELEITPNGFNVDLIDDVVRDQLERGI